jgi:hypothetical protein
LSSTTTWAVVGRADLDIGLTEDGEKVACARLLQVLAHEQVGVHTHEQHGDAPEPPRSGDAGEAIFTGHDGEAVIGGDPEGRRVEGKPENAEQVDIVSRDRLSSSRLDKGWTDGAVLGPDGNRDAGR